MARFRYLTILLICLGVSACSSSANNAPTATSSPAGRAATAAAAQQGQATNAPTAAQTARPAAAGTSTAAAQTARPAAATAAVAASPGTGTPNAAPQLPAKVTDKDGHAVTVTSIDRIVPLNGEMTEILYELGLGSKIAGADISSTYPPEAKSLPSIGYQRTLNAEAMLALKPTLVIGNENAGPPPVIDQLRSAGVPVLIIKYETTLASIPDKIRIIAQAVGLPGRGDQLVAKTQSDIDAARALAAKAVSKPKVAFLNLRGGGTQQIWGKGMPSYEMISAAGAVDAGAAAGIDGSKPITAESLATAQPDVILTTTTALESAGGIDGLLQIPGIAQTPAGDKKRVLSYEDQYLLGMGPRAGQALMELVKALHPEVK